MKKLGRVGGVVMAEPQINFAGNLKALEALKTELAVSLAEIYQGLYQGDGEKFLQAAAKMNLACYLLGKRLGLNYGHLDQEAYQTVQAMLEKESEAFPDWGSARDLTTLKNYLELKR